jgi:amino acid transporter
MNVLARTAGMPAVIGLLINMGALVSFFSCFLACITASARVLYLMGQKGALHSLLGKAHASNQTPHRAVFVSGVAAFLPLGILTWFGINGFDIYGLLGTFATFGFLTAYILVSIAAPIFLHAQGRLKFRDIAISALALVAMVLALEGTLYPVPAPPYSYLPYIYLGLLLAGLGWSVILNGKATPFQEELASDLDALVE